MEPVGESENNIRKLRPTATFGNVIAVAPIAGTMKTFPDSAAAGTGSVPFATVSVGYGAKTPPETVNPVEPPTLVIAVCAG